MLTQAKVHVRWLIRRDMPMIHMIEQDSYEHPWTEEDFTNNLRRRNVIGQVAVINDRIVGYVVYELHKKKLNILNITVPSKLRRAGIGRAMVSKLVSKLSTHRRRFITVVVRETNLDGQLFFRSCGFKAVEVLRGHFEETGEDGYKMRYRDWGEM